jgi:thiol-disulfide isomerase/thioredoxin
MITLTTSIVALTLTTVAVTEPQKSLSPAAETSRVAFTALIKAKEGVPEARVKALGLPGTQEFLASTQAGMGYYALAQSFQQFPDRSAEALRVYADLLPKIDHLRGWDGYQTTYVARVAKTTGDSALAEKIRRESASLIRRTIEKHDFESPKLGTEDVLDFFKLDLAHLDGNGMRGQLIGKRAPTVKFVWASTPGMKSLSDLKGKVVVLDFWATWCKPCVGLFPKIHEISQSYEGKPVVFVGVTSIQGWSMDPKAGKIDCKGDPKKETSLMPDLMMKLGVTWPVVFSDKDCFNPDFDIMEIPHMAIVDQEGVVRFDGVDPDDLKAKIDGLIAAKSKGSK